MHRANKNMSRHIGKCALVIALATLLLIASCATTRVDEGQTMSYISMGLAYLQAGDSTSALREFMEAEKRTPDDPAVHYYLGIAYYMKGIKEEAIRQFEKAIELKPDYSEARNYLGTVYLESGSHDKAIEEFQRVLTNILYETPALTIYNLGRAYYEKGDYDASLSYFRQALEKQPTISILPHIYHYIGLVYLNENRVDDALHYFQKSLEIAPSMIESRLQSGICHMKKGDTPRAAKEFRKVIETAPESKPAMAAARYLQSLGE